MTAIPDIPAPTFSCRVCGETWKIYALDSDGDTRALLGWRCPECTDLARVDDESDLPATSFAEISDASKAIGWLALGALVGLALIATALVRWFGLAHPHP